MLVTRIVLGDRLLIHGSFLLREVDHLLIVLILVGLFVHLDQIVLVGYLRFKTNVSVCAPAKNFRLGAADPTLRLNACNRGCVFTNRVLVHIRRCASHSTIFVDLIIYCDLVACRH